MAFNYEYPYTDPNMYNSDWLLNKMSELEKSFSDFIKVNTIKYHDPIEWSIIEQYEANYVVTHDGIAYLSKTAVPMGVPISNTDYWLPIGNFGIDGDIIRENIAIINQGVNVTADMNIPEGNWLWWGGNLYQASQNITTGDALAVGLNLEAITVEDKIQALEDEHLEVYHILQAETALEVNAELAANAGKLIVFKNKTYNFDMPMVIPDDTRIHLNNAVINRVDNVHDMIIMGNHTELIGRGLLDGKAFDDGLVNTNASDRFSCIKADGKSDILIEDVYITGNCSAEVQPEGTNCCIRIWDCTDVRIIRCMFYTNIGTGILVGNLGHLSTNVLIDGCNFSKMSGSGISGAAYNERISNCVCNECGYVFPGQYAGVFSSITLGGENATCVNCIVANGSTGYTVGHSIANDKNCMLNNCITYNMRDYNVYVGSLNANISNCIFGEMVDDGAAFAFSSDELGNPCKFTNCIFKGSGTSSPFIRGDVDFVNCFFEHTNIIRITGGIVRCFGCTFKDIASAADGKYVNIMSSSVALLCIGCRLIKTSSAYTEYFLYSLGACYMIDTLNYNGMSYTTADSPHIVNVRALP